MKTFLGRLVRGTFAVAFLAAFSITGAFAAGTVVSVKGEARSLVNPSTHGPIVQGNRLLSGMTVITAAGGQVVIRFDDGQQVVGNENTEFRITDYRYKEAEPTRDRSIFDLIKGGLRVVTGAIGKRNQSAFQVRTPQATIGIRGTDFMLVLVNPAYI